MTKQNVHNPNNSLTTMVKILVIDDEQLIGKSLKIALEKVSGYSVNVAMTGNDAIESLNKHDYDIIVTDLNLPDYKEFEIVREIRNLNSDIPVIVMSAYYPESSETDYSLHDIFRLINKPFEIDEILSGVADALK